MKQIVKSVKNFVLNHKKEIALSAALATVAAVPQIANAADVDLLKSQAGTVKSTFGLNSTVVKWIYIAEVFMSIMAYFKMRSPIVFVGLIMVMIFTRVAFAIIG